MLEWLHMHLNQWSVKRVKILRFYFDIQMTVGPLGPVQPPNSVIVASPSSIQNSMLGKTKIKLSKINENLTLHDIITELGDLIGHAQCTLFMSCRFGNPVRWRSKPRLPTFLTHPLIVRVIPYTYVDIQGGEKTQALWLCEAKKVVASQIRNKTWESMSKQAQAMQCHPLWPCRIV